MEHALNDSQLNLEMRYQLEGVKLGWTGHLRVLWLDEQESPHLELS